MKEIKSFAFIDLETTGIPEYEFFKTKITEISIISCSKNHILNTKYDELPRILSKLTVCVNPFKRIDDKATEITGLSNELLEHENRFDTNTANLITSFLLQLQQPVCLIAHNGKSFDFPILQKEISKFMNLPESLMYIDSIEAFKDIDFLEEEENAVQDLFTNNLVSVDDSNSFDSIIEEEDLQYNKTLNLQKELISDKEINWQKINERTPIRKRQQTYNSVMKHKITPVHRTFPNCRKELFPPLNYASSSSKKFTLSAIYEKYHNRKPKKSHYAEGDVISLLKCTIAVKEKFVKYVEENSKPFNSLIPLGKILYKR